MQPGETITPGSSAPSTEPKHEARQPDVPEQSQVSESEPQSQWRFSTDDAVSSVDSTPLSLPGAEAVDWTASEYMAHKKGGGWYVLLGLGAVAGAILVYIVTRDVISGVMILAVAVILGLFAGRQPRTLRYRVDSGGVHIGNKLYTYDLFKSFAVMDEGALRSITLVPLKRFMPLITMYYEPADEDKIVDALSVFLPYEERKHDVVDQLMRKLRF